MTLDTGKFRQLQRQHLGAGLAFMAKVAVGMSPVAFVLGLYITNEIDSELDERLERYEERFEKQLDDVKDDLQDLIRALAHEHPGAVIHEHPDDH